MIHIVETLANKIVNLNFIITEKEGCRFVSVGLDKTIFLNMKEILLIQTNNELPHMSAL